METLIQTLENTLSAINPMVANETRQILARN